MLKKLAIAIGASLGFAMPAFAGPPHWAPAHGWRAKHHHPHYYYRAPAHVYYPARPVVVVPPPRYYYYAPPRPVIYGRIPLSRDVDVGFRVAF